MSTHRKRSYHFTVYKGRKLYDHTAADERGDYTALEGPALRVVVSAPKTTIEVPASVEVAVFDATRPTREQLEQDLKEVRKRLHIRKLAAQQGLTGKGELGDLREIWEEAWTIEVLRYNLRLRTPEGYPVKHPGPLADYIRKHALPS